MKNGLSCLDMDHRLHAATETPAKDSPSPLLAERKVLNHTEKKKNLSHKK